MQSPVPGHHSAFRASMLCMLAAWLTGTASVAVGQSEAPVAVEPKPSDVQEPAKPDLRFSVGWVSALGLYTYVPEKWGELHINLLNARDEARELLCVTYFDQQPQLQFGRRVWMPARTKLTISHPVMIPKPDDPKRRAISFHSLVFDNLADDVLVKNESGQLLQDGSLLLAQETRTTAVIGTNDEQGFSPPEEVLELIKAGRSSHELSGKVTLLGDQFLPADETSLNCFEHIIVATDRLAEDLAAVSALRHWLNSGGHLWVMLDRVEPRILEVLLGDGFRGHLVDRVGLTSVRVDEPQSAGNPLGVIGDILEFDEPVQMARVVIPDMEVVNTVNGWPAAMTRRSGDGTLLVTTVGARGWMKPRDSTSSPSRNQALPSAHVPIVAMTNLATDFFGQREAELISESALEPQVREYVGYTVPSWGLIISLLLGFSASLIAIGIGLWRIGRLEHLGWVGSVVAVAVSIVLLRIGHSYRHGIAETVASVQVAQAMMGTDDVQTDGVIAVYNPEGNSFAVGTKNGGRMMPEMTGVENSTRRMVTTDFGVWHWENLKQPAGLRINSFTKSETVSDRIEAHATFDANGIVGKYSGRLAPGTDAMVATRTGRIGTDLQSDGSFVARAEDVFGKDQFLNARLIGDEQDRRRRTLEKLFNNPKRGDFPDLPQLTFWSDRWEHGFEFAENLKSRNSTLVTVPLVIHRPANGTEIVIPPPMLPYRSRLGPDGTPPSSMWNYNRNEWQERADPGSTWLSFHVPRELLPLSTRRARLDIAVSGPVGLIEIRGLKNGEVTTLRKVIDPVGSVSIEIDDPDVLSIHKDGTLNLGVIAGDPTRPELTRTKSSSSGAGAKVNYWRIDSLTLQLWAKADEPAAQE